MCDICLILNWQIVFGIVTTPYLRYFVLYWFLSFNLLLFHFNQLENIFILLPSLFLYFFIISSNCLQYPKVLTMDSCEGLFSDDLQFDRCVEYEDDMKGIRELWEYISTTYSLFLQVQVRSRWWIPMVEVFIQNGVSIMSQLISRAPLEKLRRNNPSLWPKTTNGSVKWR